MPGFLIQVVVTFLALVFRDPPSGLAHTGLLQHILKVHPLAVIFSHLARRPRRFTPLR